jgi:hypothetical protein
MMAKKSRPTNQPVLFTNAAQVMVTPAPRAAPREADDPDRPASISPAMWVLIRRYAHLIAVEERQLRTMQSQAPDDPRVARNLARVGTEIDALRIRILATTDAAERME